MKKILLILVSSLLILCTAGSAMAAPDSAQIWDATGDNRVDLSQIPMQPGETKYFTLYVELLPLSEDTTYEYDARVVEALDGGSVGDITIVTPPTFTIPAGVTEFKDVGKIMVSLNSNAPLNAKYRLLVGGKDFVVARATVSSVPEFPTVAAPIAGIIGLLFVFGRKKEGL